MALVPQIDFQAFVAQRKSEHSGGITDLDEPGREYSYISDRQTRAAFGRIKPVELAVNSAVRLFNQVWKGQMLGNAVKVSERQFSRIHNITKHCADTLQIPTPQVYIVASPQMNAGTYGTHDESFIMVHSAMVDHYTDEELRMVIGHECGHIHNKHVVYLTTLHYLTRFAGAFVRYIVEPAVFALRAWSRRAEITCDRAGMLCAKDAQVSARALTKLVIGSRKLYDEFNLDAFLEQYDEGKDSLGRYMEAFATHPWLPKRVLAMRVFEESALYRSAAGLGEGGITMEAVDDRVRSLLKGEA